MYKLLNIFIKKYKCRISRGTCNSLSNDKCTLCGYFVDLNNDINLNIWINF